MKKIVGWTILIFIVLLMIVGLIYGYFLRENPISEADFIVVIGVGIAVIFVGLMTLAIKMIFPEHRKGKENDSQM